MTALFDPVADDYDRWYDTPKGLAIFHAEVDCLRLLSDECRGRWLEVGVGTGRFAATLGVAEGVEQSASMRSLAECRGVRTAHGSGQCLPYPDQSFDGVLMTTTLCFLADPQKSLQECRRVLKDAGRLIVGLIPADSPWGRLYQRKAAEGHPLYSAATFHAPDEVIRLAAVAGFQLQQASSCLLSPPESVASEGKPHEGIVPDAGFVAMAFVKTSSDNPLLR